MKLQNKLGKKKNSGINSLKTLFSLEELIKLLSKFINNLSAIPKLFPGISIAEKEKGKILDK